MNENTELEVWGSHLSDCPPEDAEPAFGIVYYLVFNNPPLQKDFRPLVGRNPGEWKKRSQASKCRANGLSVYKNMEDAIKTREKYQSLRNTKPVMCELLPEYGMIKSTPAVGRPSHHTWWPPIDMEIWYLFVVIT